MAIKMRTNNSESARCCSCKNTNKNSLMMFDLCIGDKIFSICDDCNSKLLSKTLSAECKVNAMLKQPRDLEIQRKRKARANG